MHHRFLRILFAIVGLMSLLSAGCAAPAPHPGASEAVTASDARRTPDGLPDIQGFWDVVQANDDRSGPRSFPSYTVEGGDSVLSVGVGATRQKIRSVIIDPADGRIPYQPWAVERRKAFLEDGPEFLLHDPLTRCVSGMPRNMYQAGGFQIVQLPGAVTIYNDHSHFYRIIRIDGSPHAGKNLKLLMGDSIGHWDGNTLVVDVTNNSDLPWFDDFGSFRSAAVHFTERFTVVGADRINYEVTIEDPEVFTRPWKMAMPFRRDAEKGPDYELWENACHEGERELQHIVKGADSFRESRKTNARP